MKLKTPLVSVLINNYNYGRYLREAIDSVLNQTYPYIEVIVVDDGSTDNSRELIASYDTQIIPVLKENGGQGSAFNVGFSASRGDIICFLDSDDMFNPNKVQESVDFMAFKMANNPLTMMYHQLEMIDKNGISLNKLEPRYINEHASANSYKDACKYRHINHFASPTSGIVISRELARLIFPIPEQEARISADSFVANTAPLLGNMYGFNRVLSKYRVHDRNNWYQRVEVHNKAFYLCMDDFMNKKLKQNNKKPVISYFDSLVSAVYYKRFSSNLELIALSWRVISYHLDLQTVSFFFNIHKLVLKNYIKNILGIKRRSF